MNPDVSYFRGLDSAVLLPAVPVFGKEQRKGSFTVNYTAHKELSDNQIVSIPSLLLVPINGFVN